jgi:hypothetical protein
VPRSRGARIASTRSDAIPAVATKVRAMRDSARSAAGWRRTPPVAIARLGGRVAFWGTRRRRRRRRRRDGAREFASYGVDAHASVSPPRRLFARRNRAIVVDRARRAASSSPTWATCRTTRRWLHAREGARRRARCSPTCVGAAGAIALVRRRPRTRAFPSVLDADIADSWRDRRPRSPRPTTSSSPSTAWARWASLPAGADAECAARRAHARVVDDARRRRARGAVTCG